jgi:type I restriction enzyme, S subunit
MEKILLQNAIDKPISGEWGAEINGLYGVNVLRTTNFTNDGVIDYTTVVKRQIPKEKVEQKKLLKGDIIIEKSGGSPTQPVGRVVYFEHDETFLCNNFTAILRPKKNAVFPKYLFYILYSAHKNGFTGKFQNKTTGIINLQLPKYIQKTSIPLPPLEQQKKIAAILDAADAYRQLTKALIAKYDELTQSLFLDMFGDPVKNEKGWEEYKLEEICGVGSSKRVFAEELTDKGIPFYRGTEVAQLGSEQPINPSLFITEKHFEELISHTGKPQIGDLLMPSICPDGRIYRVLNDTPFYFKDGRVLWIKVNQEKINSIYLRYFLKFIFKSNYHNIASGTTFAELKIIALKNLKIQLPNLSLQNEYSQRIELINTQKAQAQASLEKAEELFNSLLQRAFKGELV